MIKGDTEIVAAIRAQLADRIGRDRCEVWFGPSTRLEVSGASLVVGVPNRFFQDWLRTHFRKDLEAAVLAASGEALTPEFRIEEPPVAAPTANHAAPADAAQAVAVAVPSVVPSSASPAPLIKLASPADAPAATPRRAWETLESFVVGNSNCLAHKAAQMVVEQPGAYSPLLLHGPSGTGKTHLLEGVCRQFRKRHPKARTVLMSAEQFTGSFLEALHGSGMPSFRRKYRDLDLLLIDDLQFLANKRATIVELLHTVDTLARAGRQLVFAADRSLANLKALGPELTGRLAGGMACRVEVAEYETRLGIVERQAVRLDVSLPRDVAEYVARQFTSQARELIGALKKLKATSLALQRPITLAMAETALAELLEHQHRVVKLADIERAVCDVLGIEAETLQSAEKSRQASYPRMLAMWLARKYTRAGLSEIGSYFGRRSHSTVISAQKKIDAWMTRGTAVKLADSGPSLEETLRRVEERLRAG